MQILPFPCFKYINKTSGENCSYDLNELQHKINRAIAMWYEMFEIQIQNNYSKYEVASQIISISVR